MNRQQLEAFKTMFMELQDAYCAQIKKAEASCCMSQDEATRAEQNREEQLHTKFISKGQYMKRMIEESLRRVDNGSYGECLDCGIDIPEERLKARPTADTCVTCQEDKERQEGHMLYQRKSRSEGRGTLNDSTSLHIGLQQQQQAS